MPDKISIGMKRLPLIILMALILSCAQTSRVPISKVIGTDTVRTKVVLLPDRSMDISYQRVAVREYENALTKQPVSRAIRTAFGGEKVDLVLVVRKEVQEVDSISPETFIALAQESDVNTVIVIKPVKIDYRQGSVTRGDEFCVSRTAQVEFSVKVGESKRGEVVFAGVYSGEAKARQCSKGIRRTDKLPSEDKLVLKAIKKSALKFSEEFWESL